MKTFLQWCFRFKLRVNKLNEKIDKKYFDYDTYTGLFNTTLLITVIAALTIWCIHYWAQEPGQEKYAGFELEKGKIYIGLFFLSILLNVLRIYVQRKRGKLGSKSKNHRQDQ
jgi:hypothetical protein